MNSRTGWARVETMPVTQRELFPVADETPPAPAAPVSLYAEVVFDRPLDQAYSYGVPDSLLGSISIGGRVLAPFGKGDRPTPGFCVGLTDQSPNQTVKRLSRVLDDRALVTPELMRLTRWMADYYLCGWGQVLNAVIPAGVKERSGTRNAIFLEALPEAVLPDPLPGLSAKQQLALDKLRSAGEPVEIRELARRANCGLGPVVALVDKKLARRFVRRVEIDLPATPGADATPLARGADASQLDAEHEEAIDEPSVNLNVDQLQAWKPIEQALQKGG